MDIEVVIDPTESDKNAVYQGLFEFNRPHFPEEDIVNLGCFAKDAQGTIVAGLTAELFTTSLFINYLWVSPEIRGSSLGRKLVEKIEAEAKERGVEDICLDTYSFQALGFYLKLGFESVGEFKDFPTKGVNKHFLQKRLLD